MSAGRTGVKRGKYKKPPHIDDPFLRDMMALARFIELRTRPPRLGRDEAGIQAAQEVCKRYPRARPKMNLGRIKTLAQAWIPSGPHTADTEFFLPSVLEHNVKGEPIRWAFGLRSKPDFLKRGQRIKAAGRKPPT
jgi:hypothetical protein